MERAYVQDHLPASADSVWRLIRNFDNISAWAPGGRILQVEGNGVGAVRRVQTPIGVAVERCESHDEPGRQFSYALLQSPWPVANYVATVRVVPLSNTQCRIEWFSHFKSKAGPELKYEVENLYRHTFIDTLKKSLGTT